MSGGRQASAQDWRGCLCPHDLPRSPGPKHGCPASCPGSWWGSLRLQLWAGGGGGLRPWAPKGPWRAIQGHSWREAGRNSVEKSSQELSFGSSAGGREGRKEKQAGPAGLGPSPGAGNGLGASGWCLSAEGAPRTGGLGRGGQRRVPAEGPRADAHPRTFTPGLCPLSCSLPPPPAASPDHVGRLLGNCLPLCRVFPRPGHRAIRHHRWPGAAPAAAAGQAQCRARRGEPTRESRPYSALCRGRPCCPQVPRSPPFPSSPSASRPGHLLELLPSAGPRGCLPPSTV